MGKKDKKPPAALARWLGYFLVLIFAAAAAHIGSKLFINLDGAYQSKNWVTTTAQLDEWAIINTPCHTLRSFSIKTGCQEITARYRYSFRGQDYSSSRVSYTQLRDNFSDSYRDSIADRLRAAETGQPLTIWVNPSSPDEAVVERALPVAATFFYSFFLLFPCGVATAAILGGIIRLAGPRDTRDARNSRWLLPSLGILHGLPALAILWLADAGTIGIAGYVMLAFLLGLFAAGVVRAAKNLLAR